MLLLCNYFRSWRAKCEYDQTILIQKYFEQISLQQHRRTNENLHTQWKEVKRIQRYYLYLYVYGYWRITQFWVKVLQGCVRM
jgi:hypothetical protein